MWNPAVSGMEKVRIRTILSYWRIRRYLVLPFKTAEKHVTSSHVRFTTIRKINIADMQRMDGIAMILDLLFLNTIMMVN